MTYYVCKNESKNFWRSVPVLTADLVKTNILRSFFSANKTQRCTLQVTTGRCLGRIHISSDPGCWLVLPGLFKTWILAITTFCIACPLSTHCFPYGRLSSPKEKKYDLICWILQRTNSTNFEIKLDNRNVSYCGLAVHKFSVEYKR